jgi:geranylgeranyl diphosphate synthase, type II
MAERSAAIAIDFGADRTAIDRALASFCERYLESVPAPVGDAIRYSLMGEGKRLRGILFLRAYEAAGGAGDAAPLAAAIEVVHAYSLVHDDLPCMDDDDMRRGRPTVHRVFGVPAATRLPVSRWFRWPRCARRMPRERSDCPRGRPGSSSAS